MTGIFRDIFPDVVPIDSAAAEESRADFAKIPAKPAVYLLAGNDDAGTEQPLLLATVGDLRAALKRRLADNPADQKTKRVAYAAICTRVCWRQVHSTFAANYWYARAAHALFPDTARALIPWRDSWWIAVERDPATTPFPRFRKTNSLADPALAYVGPVRDKHVAARLIESIEDLFDLCRYHNILVQAPHGKACAYKEMGKCPAPCDGSETLASYRARIDAALAFAADENRDAWRADVEAQMKAAAAAQEFEKAGRIRQRLTRAGLWQNVSGGERRRDGDATMGRLEDFAYLTLQPGKGRPWIEPWLAAAGSIQCLPQFNVKDLSAAAEALAGQCRSAAWEALPRVRDAALMERVALITHHLMKGENDHGMWLRAKDIAADGPAAVIAAVEQLRARKAPKPLAEQSSDIAPTSTGENATAAAT